MKLLGDNPDAMYYIARVDPSRRYRVEGCRDDDEVYFSLSVHAAARKGEAFQRVADLNDAAIATARTAAGRRCFTVAIGGPEPSDGTNWLRLPAEAATVVTRSYSSSTRRRRSMRWAAAASTCASSRWRARLLPPALPADGGGGAPRGGGRVCARAHGEHAAARPDDGAALRLAAARRIGKPAVIKPTRRA